MFRMRDSLGRRATFRGLVEPLNVLEVALDNLFSTAIASCPRKKKKRTRCRRSGRHRRAVMVPKGRSADVGQRYGGGLVLSGQTRGESPVAALTVRVERIADSREWDGEIPRLRAKVSKVW